MLQKHQQTIRINNFSQLIHVKESLKELTLQGSLVQHHRRDDDVEVVITLDNYKINESEVASLIHHWTGLHTQIFIADTM
jgi:hypothetical protein